MAQDLEFRIDSWTPATLPLQRLGEYMIEVARLYGETSSVHFHKLRAGSAVLVSRVDETARPKVQDRLRSIRIGVAPPDANQAYRRLDSMLANDNAIGLVRGLGQGLVIRFAGRDRTKPSEYAGVREQGVLEGEIVRIGGKDKTVHLSLQTGEAVLSAIETDRDMARRLGQFIFGPAVRLHGLGMWSRSEDGIWSLDRFVVSHFDVMDGRSFGDAVREIRELRGSTWGADKDPVASVLEFRSGIRKRLR